MNIETLKQFIINNPLNWHIQIKNKEVLYKLLIKITSPALKNINKPSFALLKTILFNNTLELPRCPICNSEITKCSNKKGKPTFNLFCSGICSSSEEGKNIIQNLRVKTFKEKYGVSNPSELKETNKKRKETLISRYGVDNAMKSQDIRHKVEDTMLKKYGVKNPSQAEEIKEKKKETSLKKYGVENPFQAEEIKEKIKETMLEKYGVEHAAQSEEIKEKKKETTLIRYGVENAFQSEEIKGKIKKTNLQKYGVEHVAQSKEIKEKKRKTCLKKYEVENPAQIEEIKEKIKKTNLEKYGAVNYMQSPQVRTSNLKKLKIHMKHKNLEPLFTDEEYIYSQINDELKYRCLTCNTEYSVINNPSIDKGIYNQNFLCTCSKYRSIQEIELAEFLESLEIPFKNNYKPESNRYELDLFMPEHNLGIEHNGLYWHSELKKQDNYHQEKYLFFKEHNIDVIQIFGNEWASKRHIVESIIKRRLGKSDYILSSEETEIRTPSYQDYLNFLEENSIHSIPGTTPTQILGLYYNDSLVQLLALNNSEIVASTTKLDYAITNGLHKLLSNLNQNLTVQIDLRYSTGQEFIECGFTPTNITEPSCFYTDYKDIHQTEINNSYKIYDCGSLVLISIKCIL